MIYYWGGVGQLCCFDLLAASPSGRPPLSSSLSFFCMALAKTKPTSDRRYKEISGLSFVRQRRTREERRRKMQMRAVARARYGVRIHITLRRRNAKSETQDFAQSTTGAANDEDGA